MKRTQTCRHWKFKRRRQHPASAADVPSPDTQPTPLQRREHGGRQCARARASERATLHIVNRTFCRRSKAVKSDRIWRARGIRTEAARPRDKRSSSGRRGLLPVPQPRPRLTAVPDDEQLEEVIVVPGHAGSWCFARVRAPTSTTTRAGHTHQL